MTRSVLAVAAMLVLGAGALAQDISDQAEVEALNGGVPTSIEKLDAATGRPVVIGYTRIGSLRGYYNSWLTVECQEHVDMTSSDRTHGISIDVRMALPGPRYRRSTLYVDYDEIAPLIKGLEFISRLDGRYTRLQSYRAQYRTKGGLLVATVEPDNGGANILVVGGTEIGTARAGFTAESIYDLIRMVTEAKAQIDAARSAPSTAKRTNSQPGPAPSQAAKPKRAGKKG